jgi:hypothetical protein
LYPVGLLLPIQSIFVYFLCHILAAINILLLHTTFGIFKLLLAVS